MSHEVNVRGTVRLDHVALAVRDTAAALRLYAETLGLAAEPSAEVGSEGVVATFLDAGGTRLELLEPTSPESAVGRFLERRGEGMHHICLEVGDIALACAELAGRGYTVVGEGPRRGRDGRQFAFVHPNSAHGVLVELYERRPAAGDRPAGAADARPGDGRDG